jgi:hypothetical protein
LDTAVCQVTVTWPLPASAVTPPGAAGTVDGIAAAVGAEGTPIPMMLVAATVKVYDRPFCRLGRFVEYEPLGLWISLFEPIGRLTNV